MRVKGERPQKSTNDELRGHADIVTRAQDKNGP